MEELSFSTNELTLLNMDRLTDKSSRLMEQRMLEIYDIASDAAKLSCELLADGFSIHELLSLISDGIGFGKYRVHKDVLIENLNHISKEISALSNFDKVAFSDMYIKALSEAAGGFDEESFFRNEKNDESFVYVRNALSDEAYDVLSQDFLEPRVKYLNSFKDCVWSVANNEAAFCLLPFEEKGGVRLQGVGELIYSCDLRICSVTPVFGALYDIDLKYALVSRDIMLPKRKEGDDRYLELRIPKDGGESLDLLLSAILQLGMSLYRIDTMTFSSEHTESAFYSLVIRDEGKDFSAIFAYLGLFLEEAQIVGVYKNLE